jgi:3D (Asp-Asp-Asp) domain-containing protein/peptidoglycan hydrolase CwlO-like protein
VRGPGRGLRTLCLVVLAGTAVCATLPAGGSAESAGELERRAQALREQNASLAAGAQSAAAGLIAIEQRLSQTRAELASFQARAAQVQARRRAVADELGVARSALRGTQRALGKRLQALYEQGEADTLAVVLGAGSLDDALNAIEAIDLAAAQDESLIETARSASTRLAALKRRLVGRERELEQLAAARAAAAASLADARSERLRTIAALRSTSRSNTAAIASLEGRARTLASVAASAQSTVPVPGAPRLQPSPGTGGVRSLTVVATGYALGGRTASGQPVGWGVVAVDPSVIPMGSRLGIPGYGVGVAADTGGAIQGARIDLWFPSVAQARAWGSRVITITVYSN